MRILVVISTGGAVINEILSFPIMKNSIYSFLLDRKSKAINVAKRHGVQSVLLEERNSLVFSDFVLEYAIEHGIDYIYSFYLKLFKGNLLTVFQHRIINFHPSILPSFSGFNPILRAMEYRVKVTGTTVHFIDETMDQGLPILQTIIPISEKTSIDELTHNLFVQQCKSVLQLTKWLVDSRLEITNNKCIIINSKYELSEYFPNLDYEDAIMFNKHKK